MLTGWSSPAERQLITSAGQKTATRTRLKAALPAVLQDELPSDLAGHAGWRHTGSRRLTIVGLTSRFFRSSASRASRPNGGNVHPVTATRPQKRAGRTRRPELVTSLSDDRSGSLYCIIDGSWTKPAKFVPDPMRCRDGSFKTTLADACEDSRGHDSRLLIPLFSVFVNAATNFIKGYAGAALIVPH